MFDSPKIFSSTERLSRINDYIVAGNALYKYLRNEHAALHITKIELDILRNISPLYNLTAAIHCIYALRLSELHLVDINKFASGESQILFQTKNSAQKFLPSINLPPQTRNLLLGRHLSLINSTHTSYILSYNDCIPDYLLYLLRDEMNKSHIFRHIRASYLLFKGFTPEEIQSVLGHLDINTQSRYIHEELFSLFS